jgi:hypothetical protein
MPHVTLAAGDLEEARLPAVLAALDECSTRFPARLESFTVIEVALPHYPRLGSYPYQSAEQALPPRRLQELKGGRRAGREDGTDCDASGGAG